MKSFPIIVQMKPFAISLLVVFIAFTAFAQTQETVQKIDIKGNQVVSSSTIISKIKTRANQPYNDNVVNEDIKNLYATGYFEDIEVQKETGAEGIIVTFVFKEKPIVKEILIEGTKKIHRKKIEKLIEIENGSFVNEYALKELENAIVELYHKKGFSEVAVTYAIATDKDNQATITYHINEKSKIRIKKIIVKGNISFTTKRIKKLMRTKKKGWFSRGILKEETLSDDLRRIEDFYKERGFSEVTVKSALDVFEENVYVTITIQEGERYFIGRIKIDGNEEISFSTINETVTLATGDIYVEKKVNEVANNIKGVYVDAGYIFAQIQPVIFFNPETKKMDITYRIRENDLAYVERIDIKGNIKTKDKVIRRELRIYPGDKFEGTKIKKSRERLENTGYFEEVRFNSSAGSQPDYENIIVDVKEAKTGYISFGGGYSSIDEFTGFVELRQHNFDYQNWQTFTGAGQDISVLASFGTVTERYELSFLNPWIFDRPIHFGFEGYRRGHRREEDVGYGFDESVKGGAFKFGKDFSDNLKGWAGYRFDRVAIEDVVDTASQTLKDEQGTNDLNSLEFSLNFDTRDNVFVPTTGLVLSNSFEVTGGFLGGDKDFLKFTTRFSKYFALVKKSVLEFRFRLGVAEPFDTTNKIPIYDRFFAGGSSTIRGYNERKVGPIDPLTEDPVGGESLVVANLEYTYPVVDVIKAAVFFDTGNVWEKKGDIFSGGFKSSVGFGLRVKTPIGPISVDYGWPLDLEPGEDSKQGKFHFNVSRGF